MNKYMLYKRFDEKEYVWEVIAVEVHEITRDGINSWKENHFTLRRSLGNGFYYKIPYGIRESLCKEVYKED